MRWIVSIDGRDASRGIAWARAFLARFDTSRVEWVRIDLGRGRFSGAYGRCWYPDRNRKTYRISCQVPGPFPTTIRTRKPPIYERPDGTWPLSWGNPDGTPLAANLPSGCELGAFVEDMRDGSVRRWFRVVGRTELRDIDEGVVWVLAHEAFHFLRKTRQVPGCNTEIEADAFADRMLDEFRAGREETPAKPGEVPGSQGACS